MRCPICAGRVLRIDVVLRGAVTCQFEGETLVAVLETSELSSTWHPESACDCLACRWSGTVTEAAQCEADLDSIGPYLSSELDEIEDDLEEGSCPVALEGTVRSLLEDVRLLHLRSDRSRPH